LRSGSPGIWLAPEPAQDYLIAGAAAAAAASSGALPPSLQGVRASGHLSPFTLSEDNLAFAQARLCPVPVDPDRRNGPPVLLELGAALVVSYRWQHHGDDQGQTKHEDRWRLESFYPWISFPRSFAVVYGCTTHRGGEIAMEAQLDQAGSAAENPSSTGLVSV
jgi:hypothetical protein